MSTAAIIAPSMNIAVGEVDQLEDAVDERVAERDESIQARRS